MKKLNSVLLWSGILFLAYLVWRIGPGEISRELGLLGWGLVPFVLGEGVAEMIHTIAWRYCLDEPHRSLPWWYLFRVRMSGYAINYLTPLASMGGEVTKVSLLATRDRGPAAVSGVLIEKASFALAQLLFVTAGSVFLIRYASLPRPLWLTMLFGGAIVAGGIVAFMLLQKHGKMGGLVRWLDARTDGRPILQTAAVSISGVDNALRAFYRDRPRDLWRSIAWHLAGCLIGILQMWWFLYLLQGNASWLISATAWTLAMWFDLLTFVIPLNVGSLEGSRILTFRAVGCNSISGLTYGVAVRVSQLVWSAVGLLLYGSLELQESRPALPRKAAALENRKKDRAGCRESTAQAQFTRDSLNSRPVETEPAKQPARVVAI